MSAAGQVSIVGMSADDICAYQSILNDIARFADNGQFHAGAGIDPDIYNKLPESLTKRLSDCILTAESKTRNIVTLFDLADVPFIDIYPRLTFLVAGRRG